MTELAQGYRGLFGFGKQTAIDTGVAATAFQTIYPSVSLQENRPGRTRFVGIRRDQNYQHSTKGPINVSGSVSGPLIPDEAFHGIVLAALLGNNNSVSGSATVGYTHVLSQPTPTTTANYPAAGATLELNLGSSGVTLHRDFIGCFLSKYQISGKENGPVDVVTDWVGRSQTDGDTVASATYSSVPAFEPYMATLSIGTSLASMSTVEITDFNIAISNGVKMLVSHATRYPIDRAFGLIDAILEFGMYLREDLTIYNYFKNETEMAVKLVLTHTTLAGSSSGYHTLQFEFPRVIFIGDPPNLNNTDEIKHSVKMQALKGTGSDLFTVKITAINSQSGTYAV